MQEITERLKKEKKQMRKRWFEKGKEDGFEFAESADYQTLQFAIKHVSFEDIMRRERNTIGYDPGGGGVLGGYFSGIMEHYQEQGMGFDETMPGYYIPNEVFCEWELGWVEGVNEFWNEVKDKL